MSRVRRQRSTWAFALGVSLGVHALVLVLAMTIRAPMRGEASSVYSEPLVITLERPQPETAAPAAAAGSPAPAAQARVIQAVSPLAAPAPSSAPPAALAQGTGEGPPAAAHGSGASAGPVLKFDCAEAFGARRPDQLRADPCQYRNAPRDRLPKDVVKQASINADKAAYYDRVLEARQGIINDPNRGNTPLLYCGIRFGGGKPPKVQGPLHSLKLGPLPCFLVPPEGPLDPEVFVEPIPSKNPGKPGDAE